MSRTGRGRVGTRGAGSRGAGSRSAGFLRAVWARPGGAFGTVVVAVVVAVALLSLVWTPRPLDEADAALRLQGPSWQHLLGTDKVGRDTLSRLLAGSRTTVVVVAGATSLAAAVGIALAALSGLLPARWAEPLVVLVDVLVALPVMLLAMLLAAPFGGSLAVVVISCGFGAGVSAARVLRPEVQRLAHADFILASRAAGTGAPRRLVHHVLPNIAPVAVVQLTWAASTSILAEAGLTFLGYGAPPSTPSWGRSLADAQAFIGVAPSSVVWPGLTIAVTVVALTQLGDAMRDALDPQQRVGAPRPPDPALVAGGPRAVEPPLGARPPLGAGPPPAPGRPRTHPHPPLRPVLEEHR